MERNKTKVYVILPAAGSGQRFGASLPKQFIEVRGKPIICYTVEAFLRIAWIEKIIVTIAEEWKEHMEKLIELNGYHKIQLVIGKDTRHRSIFAGIQALNSCDKTDVVVVHDAVRPFLEKDFLKQIVDAAILYKASGAVRNLVSTIVKSDENGFMGHSLVRSQYRESHTPQAFHYEVILQAYVECSEDDFIFGTECLNLVRKNCKISAKLLDGPEYLWKVTHEKDIILMESYLKKQEKKP